MERALLDSNIIIAIAQGKLKSAKLNEFDFSVSDISRLEVLGYHKISQQESDLLESFFLHVSVISIRPEIMERAIAVRRLYNMSVGDALIAATCLCERLLLLTANVKDFDRLVDLRVHNPLI